MTATAPPAGLTLLELALRLGRSADDTAALVRPLLAAGLVAEDGSGRLSVADRAVLAAFWRPPGRTSERAASLSGLARRVSSYLEAHRDDPKARQFSRIERGVRGDKYAIRLALQGHPEVFVNEGTAWEHAWTLTSWNGRGRPAA